MLVIIQNAEDEGIQNGSFVTCFVWM